MWCCLLSSEFYLNILAFLIHTLILSIVAASSFVGYSLTCMLQFTFVPLVTSMFIPVILLLKIFYALRWTWYVASLSNIHYKILPLWTKILLCFFLNLCFLMEKATQLLSASPLITSLNPITSSFVQKLSSSLKCFVMSFIIHLTTFISCIGIFDLFATSLKLFSVFLPMCLLFFILSHDTTCYHVSNSSHVGHTHVYFLCLLI